MSEAALRLLDQDLPRVDMYSPAFRRRVLETRKIANAAAVKAAGQAEIALRRANREKAIADAKAALKAEKEMLKAAKAAQELTFNLAEKIVAERMHQVQLVDEGIPIEPKTPAIDIIKDVASKYGLSVDIIRGRSRSGPVVAVRHEAMARVHVARPDLSLPALGRIFNRDHTSLLFALRKMGVRA